MNFNEYNKINDLYHRLKHSYFDKKYDRFVKEATKYLSYRENHWIRLKRAEVNIILKNYSEAESDLKLYLNDKSVKKIKYALMDLFNLYFIQGRYKEALKLLPYVKRIDVSDKFQFILVELIMKKSLGIPVETSDYRYKYTYSQVLDYSDEKALEHIKSHLNEDDKYHSVFNEKIDLKYLFDKVKENLCTSKKDIGKSMIDVYYFGISNVGYTLGQIDNYVKVIVIPNTYNIVTLYPTFEANSDTLNYLDIDYNKLFQREEPKQKVKSRIDKFNEKYNRG